MYGREKNRCGSKVQKAGFAMLQVFSLSLPFHKGSKFQVPSFLVTPTTRHTTGSRGKEEGEGGGGCTNYGHRRRRATGSSGRSWRKAFCRHASTVTQKASQETTHSAAAAFPKVKNIVALRKAGCSKDATPRLLYGLATPTREAAFALFLPSWLALCLAMLPRPPRAERKSLGRSDRLQ